MEQGGAELSGPILARAARLGDDFLLAFWRARLATRRDDRAGLAELGELCTRLRLHDEALAADRRLVELEPGDELARYNLACSLACSGELEAAWKELSRAVELGFADGAHLAADEDLKALRGDERFQALVKRLGG